MNAYWFNPSVLSLSQRCAIGLIAIYQKKVSPHKGFVCAHRKLHGGDSCSRHAQRLITDLGILGAWQAMPKRFAECRAAAAQLRSRCLKPAPQAQAQARSLAMVMNSTADFEGDDADVKAVQDKASSEGGTKEKRSSKNCGGCDLPVIAGCDGCAAIGDCSALECGGGFGECAGGAGACA